MSNLSTQVFGDMNYLYEHIANRDAQQINENSDYYDEEFAELVEDILATISSSMVCEGYSANAIITFLATSSEQDIIEKYLNFDENILTESVVSEDYIIEQLEIFDFAINEGLLGGAIKLLGRIASKPARMKVAQKMMSSKNPAKTAAAVDRLARMKLNKAGAPSDFTKKIVDAAPDVATKTRIAATAPVVGGVVKGVQKVKDIAKSAKAVLKSPTAKKVALGTAALGAATGAGYLGAKMAGAGDQSLSAKPKPNSPATQKPPAAPKLPAPAGNGGGGGGASSSSVKPKVTAKPKETDKGPAGETAMQKWARLHPTLASRVKPGQSGYDEISKTRVKPGSNEKKNQIPTTGPEASDAQKSQAGEDVTAFQAKQKADFEKKQKEVAASTQKESYDAYDLVLEYLFDNGHATTITEAEYVMSELDESFIQSLVETYHANLLAEEVVEWVNELVEEGYDLSEYTWDDMVDYYFTEAKVDTGSVKEKQDSRNERAGRESGREGTLNRRFQHRLERGFKTKGGGGKKYPGEGGKFLNIQNRKKADKKDAENTAYNDRQRVETRGTWYKN